MRAFVQTMILLICVIFIFSVGAAAGRFLEQVHTENCIDYWWHDPDGILEASWWSKYEAEVNVESQKMYLKEICK